MGGPANGHSKRPPEAVYRQGLAGGPDAKKKMKRALHLLFLMAILSSACSGARLSRDEARKRIVEIGSSSLVPNAVEIRRIVSQDENQAIAETTVTLAFQFKRDKPGNQWRVAAVRLGDRDWISLDELLVAINDGRRRETLQSLQKLAAVIANFRQRNGSLPNATDIVTLTDILHPLYMTDLIREDAWGHPIVYEVTAPDFRLRSYGADGLRGTQDDIVLPGDGGLRPQ